MSVTLSCGCRAESQTEGILCEWDAESREGDAAIAFGCVCAIHYRELNARPAEDRSLAEEITEGFEALKKIRELEAEIAELKNARDYWCLQYKDVFNKLEAQEK